MKMNSKSMFTEGKEIDDIKKNSKSGNNLDERLLKKIVTLS